MDDADSSLVPETSVTPRHGPTAEPPATEHVGDEPTLGSVLELRWDQVTALDAIWRERVTRGSGTAAPLELRLRAVASCPSRPTLALATTPSSHVISIAAADAASRATWEIPSDDSVVRVALTQALVSLTASTRCLVLLTVSLQPRRSSNGAWQLCFTLALSSAMLRLVLATGRCVDAPLCDEDGVAVGVAKLRLRCGEPTTLPSWDDSCFLSAAACPKHVCLSLMQLKRIAAPTPGDVVLEISVTGQESRRGFRSRPWTPGEPILDAIGAAVVLDVADCWTQAIRFVVMQYTPKARAYRLAEGFIAIAELATGGIDDDAVRDTICVELLAVDGGGAKKTDPQQRRSRSERQDGEATSVGLWGELTVSLEVSTPVRTEATETPRYAATLLEHMQSGSYEATLDDAHGTLEIEVVDATIDGNSNGNSNGNGNGNGNGSGNGNGNGDASLRVDLSVVPGAWTQHVTTSWRADTPPQHRRLTFGSERLAAPVRWTKNERVIPSLGCKLTLTHRLQPTAIATATRDAGTSRRAAVVTRVVGAQSMQLPVLFAYPGEWICTAIDVTLRATADGSDADATCTSVRATLRLRVRFITSDTQAAEAGQTALLDGHGTATSHLSVSNVRASGAFLRATRPQDVFAVTVHTVGNSTIAEVRRPAQGLTAAASDDGCVLWTAPVHCELPPTGAFAPLLVFKVWKTATSIDELVGQLWLPLPRLVLQDQHLVTFSLPLGAAASGATSDATATRKCGTLSFDLQVADVARAHRKQQEAAATTKLMLQRVSWSHTPAALALAMLSHRFALRCELSIVSGASLSDVLWQHATPILDAVDTAHAPEAEYVVNHTVLLPKQVLQQLNSVQGKSVLILKLLSTSGDAGPLGQAVVAVRDGWERFTEREKDVWHRIYAVGTRSDDPSRGNGSPEAVGAIQLSVVDAVEADAAAVVDDRHWEQRSVDGSLYVLVDEAVVDVDCLVPLGIPPMSEAHVEVQLLPNTTKPQRSITTRRQDASTGRWHWDSDTLLVLPWVENDGTDTPTQRVTLTLVAEKVHRLVVASNLNLHALVAAARACDGDAFVEEWLVSPDGAAQVRVRLRYVPAVAGTLRLELLRLQPQCASVANAPPRLPLCQLALRCTSSGGAAVTSRWTPIPSTDADHWRQWPLLGSGGTTLELPLCATTAMQTALPTVTIQIVGVAVNAQEICVAESDAIPITAALLGPSDASTRWVALYARHAHHNATQRLAVASLRLQFQPNAVGTNSPQRQRFGSYDDWRCACASVLVLWKRLFYRLDVDQNGRIDVREFRALFLDHAEVFRETTDGAMLLRVLLQQGQRANDRAAEDARDFITVTTHSVDALFADMDRNHDQSIEWVEYVDYLQAKLLALEPPRVAPVTAAVDIEAAALPLSPGMSDRPAKAVALVLSDGTVVARERRTKRREDRVSRDFPNHADANERATPATPPSRASVRELRSAVRDDRTRRNDHDTDPQLVTKLQTADALLAVERQKTTRLQDELRTLRLAYHQLQLQQERTTLVEKTQERFVDAALQSHDALLRDRAATRAQHHAASIKLQSKVRARLEQKKFQALKLQRWTAALRLQCAYRRCIARRRLGVLQHAERVRQQRLGAATTLQRFVRFHVRRHERQLLRLAREVSATLVQTYVRRWLAVRRRSRRVAAVQTLQRWHRGVAAVHYAKRLRVAVTRLKHWLRGRLGVRRWTRVKQCTCHVQRWWRRANEQRALYLTQVEAAMCLQALWRGSRQRQRWRMLEAKAMEPDDDDVVVSMEAIQHDAINSEDDEMKDHEALMQLPKLGAREHELHAIEVDTMVARDLDVPLHASRCSGSVDDIVVWDVKDEGDMAEFRQHDEHRSADEAGDSGSHCGDDRNDDNLDFKADKMGVDREDVSKVQDDATAAVVGAIVSAMVEQLVAERDDEQRHTETVGEGRLPVGYSDLAEATMAAEALDLDGSVGIRTEAMFTAAHDEIPPQGRGSVVSDRPVEEAKITELPSSPTRETTDTASDVDTLLCSPVARYDDVIFELLVDLIATIEAAQFTTEAVSTHEQRRETPDTSTIASDQATHVMTVIPSAVASEHAPSSVDSPSEVSGSQPSVEEHDETESLDAGSPTTDRGRERLLLARPHGDIEFTKTETDRHDDCIENPQRNDGVEPDDASVLRDRGADEFTVMETEDAVEAIPPDQEDWGSEAIESADGSDHDRAETLLGDPPTASHENQTLAAERMEANDDLQTHRTSDAPEVDSLTLESSKDPLAPSVVMDSIEDPALSVRRATATDETDDSDLETSTSNLASSAESDDLMLLDATAVTQFQQDNEPDEERDRSKPQTVDRDDSDKMLLLDLEGLRSLNREDTTTTTDARDAVVVADLD